MNRSFRSAAERSRSMMAAVVVTAALGSLSTPTHVAAADPTQAVEAISRYCQACWRNARLHPDHWQDCTQEVLARLLETVDRSKWADLLKVENDDRKEFIRAIDAVKKRSQRSRKFATLAVDVDDYRNGTDEPRQELRETVRTVAETHLSDRQRRILELSGDGWPIPEIADALQTSVARVSDEKYKAIRKLRKHLDVSV